MFRVHFFSYFTTKKGKCFFFVFPFFLCLVKTFPQKNGDVLFRASRLFFLIFYHKTGDVLFCVCCFVAGFNFHHKTRDVLLRFVFLCAWFST